MIVLREALADDNRIAAEFYDGPRWPRVRAWERLFWLVNGGERRARQAVLRCLPAGAGLRHLDVAIGDGVYASWLPADWRIVGVDISAVQLRKCRRLNAGPRSRARPQPGGEPAVSRPSVRRGPVQRRLQPLPRPRGGAARDGPDRGSRAPVVVADEKPDFLDIGHRVGAPALDRWIAARVMSMGDAFAGVVERHRRLDVEAIGRRVLKDSRYDIIWRGLGYRMVGAAP